MADLSVLRLATAARMNRRRALGELCFPSGNIDVWQKGAGAMRGRNEAVFATDMPPATGGAVMARSGIVPKGWHEGLVSKSRAR